MADIGMRGDESVGRFIERVVKPDTDYLRKTGEVIDTIVYALHQQSRDICIKEIIKGGSLGKGTAIKGKSDIDLLVVINNYNVGQLQNEIQRRGLLTKIREKFEFAVKTAGAQYEFTRETQFSVQFELKTDYNGDWHDVDILPIADIDANRKQSIYEEMRRKSQIERKFYSASLCKLQIEFVKYRNSKMKDVIRFCKYWKKAKQIDLPSYGIELIAIKVWEEESTERLEDLIKAVFTKLMNFRSIAISWNENYNSNLYDRMNKPYIRDPANPFMNVLQHTSNLDRIQTQAGQMRASIR